MATSTQNLVCDSSTVSNFIQWASPFSAFLAGLSGAPWKQSNDTGQVVWTATVLTLTQVAVSGGNAVYSYSGYTGPAPRVGMSVTFSGFSNGGNNVTATLTAVSGGSSGTVTVGTSTQVNETHAGSGTTTAITSVPGSGAFVYEIWQPNDSLANFYLKLEYGNVSGSSNDPTFRLSVSEGTDGAGTLNGGTGTLGPIVAASATYTVPSSSAQYECDFSAASGRMAAMFWRTGINVCQQFFAIERSVDSTGAYTGSHVTIFTCGNHNNSNHAIQASFLFGVGPAPASYNDQGNGYGAWISRACIVQGTSAFNGSIPFDTCSPCVGFFDYQLTVVGSAYQGDIVEGVTFTAVIYGSTRTYLPSKAGRFIFAAPGDGFANSSIPTTGGALCMRFD